VSKAEDEYYSSCPNDDQYDYIITVITGCSFKEGQLVFQRSFVRGGSNPTFKRAKDLVVPIPAREIPASVLVSQDAVQDAIQDSIPALHDYSPPMTPPPITLLPTGYAPVADERIKAKTVSEAGVTWPAIVFPSGRVVELTGKTKNDPNLFVQELKDWQEAWQAEQFKESPGSGPAPSGKGGSGCSGGGCSEDGCEN